MTSAAKPTKGPCIVKFRKDDSCYISIGDPVNGPHKQFDMPFERSYANDEADAMLVEETFNVYTETGRTPRQLADERTELIEIVRDFVLWFEEGETGPGFLDAAHAIIAKVDTP
jgi:hypothetical protein